MEKNVQGKRMQGGLLLEVQDLSISSPRVQEEHAL